MRSYFSIDRCKAGDEKIEGGGIEGLHHCRDNCKCVVDLLRDSRRGVAHQLLDSLNLYRFRLPASS